MVPNSEWVLASGNKGKLREFQDLFAPWGVNWVAQGELGVSDAEEPFHTFVENALTKARHASRLTGRPALADDSGLCVPAIGGHRACCRPAMPLCLVKKKAMPTTTPA